MKKHLFYLILLALAAFSLAGVGAWFSVYGLTKVFPAGMLTFILFGTLEFSKLVIVSFMYRFWDITKFMQKIYLISAVVILMAITSAGIYGFLTSSYQSTSNELTLIDSESKILQNEKQFLELEKTRYQDEINSKNNQIDTYIGNRSAQETLITDLYSKSTDTTLNANESWVYRTRAKQTQDGVKVIDDEITNLRTSNTELYSKINVINDSIASLDRQLIVIQNTDFAAEIGPLKYLSNLTGEPMDNVVNWLSLLIIFVFDPLAIVLLISFNQLLLHSEVNGVTKKLKFKKPKNNKQTMTNKKEEPSKEPIKKMPVNQAVKLDKPKVPHDRTTKNMAQFIPNKE